MTKEQLQRRLPKNVLGAIRQHLGVDADDSSKDGEIAQMSLGMALEAYLVWEGIIGFTDNIIKVVEAWNFIEI